MTEVLMQYDKKKSSMNIKIITKHGLITDTLMMFSNTEMETKNKLRSERRNRPIKD